MKTILIAVIMILIVLIGKCNAMNLLCEDGLIYSIEMSEYVGEEIEGNKDDTQPEICENLIGRDEYQTANQIN